MSNRLTFSLASLILIFAFGFATMPVMAADGGPTVTIGTITGNRAADTNVTPPKTGITVEVTYSAPVTINLVDGTDLKFTLKDGAGNNIAGLVNQDADSAATIPATLPGSPALHDKFLFTLPNITNTAARTVVVWVPADGATGETTGGTTGPGNQASTFETHTLPPVLAFNAALTAAQKKDNDTDIAGRFTVTLTVKKTDKSAPTDSEVSPAPTVADIMITPMGAATAVDANGAAVVGSTALAVGTANDGIYTQDYQLGYGFSDPESVTLTLVSGYMANTPSVKLPLADPVYQNPPTVTLTVSEHNKTNRVFRVDVTTTPANDTEGMAGKAIAGTAIKAKLSVKDSSTPPIDVGVKLLDNNPSNERSGDNSYSAYLEYTVFDELPLTVSIDPNDLATNPDAADVAPVTDGVGGAPTTPPVAGAPGMPTGVAAAADQAADTVTLSWTAPTDTGGSDITGYAITQTGQADASYTAAADATSYTTPELAVGNYSFTVAATNATGTGAASAAVTATIDAAPVTPVYTAPTFAVESIGDITLWTGQEYQSGELPPASHDEGDSLSYSFDPPLPAGLSLRATDEEDRFITGTPTAVSDKTHSYTATSTVTSLKDTIEVKIEVKAPVAPTAPTIVSAMEEGAGATPRTVNTNKVVVTWTGPTGEFGAAVSGYKVYWTGPKDGDGTVSSATTMTFTTPTALPIGTYNFQVAAINSVGEGPKSTTLPVIVADVPDRPTNLSAALVPNTKTVTLNWLAPEENGGAPITGYQVSVIDNSGTGRVRTFEVGTVTTATTPTLDPGQYIFRVAAENMDGLGMASDNTTPPTVVPTQPVDPANNPPTFGNESIASISATVGMAITGVTLPAATDPDGDTLYYSLSPTPPTGITFDANTRYLSGTPTAASSLTTYTYTVSDRRVGGAASLKFQIQVMGVSVKPPTIEIPTANSSSAPIPLAPQFDNPQVQVPAYGFAVLVRDVDGSGTYDPTDTWRRSGDTALPDLAWFFGGTGGTNGGTIALHGPATAEGLVISEIMWGTDSSLAVPERSQWIEFYNPTASAIPLTGCTITFHRSLVHESAWLTPAPLDIVSNAGITDRLPVHKYHPPWAPKGQSGKAGTTVITSMYREINFTARTVPSGAAEASWSASVYPTANIYTGRVGTPGAATIVRINYKETPISRGLLINEIGNSTNDAYDWVEIYNPGTENVNMKNMMFTTVWDADAGDGYIGQEKVLFRFPNADFNIKPKHYIVFAASDPKDAGNDLAAGIDVTKGDKDQPNKGLGSHEGIEHQDDNTTAFYRILPAVNLPNDGKARLYLLRSNTDGAHIGAHPDAQKNVVDVIGSLAIPLQNETPSNWTQGVPTETGRTDTGGASARRIYDTKMWPLQWSNKDMPYGKSVPHGKRVDGAAPALGNNKVYQRHGDKLPNAENHLTTAAYTGVGYDRHAPVNGENGGTPGYANGTVNEREGGGGISALKDQVSISEIMLVPHEAELTDEGIFVIPSRLPRATKLPQWIEIYNSSLTEGVNIQGWKLEIQNTDQDEDLITRDLHSTLTIREPVIIPPNQTVLIVSAAGLHSGNFPSQRMINLFLRKEYRDELSLENRNDPILSQVGFHLELRDSKNRYVDAVGNLRTSTRRGYEPRASINYDPVWDTPVMNHPSGPRTSLIRIYHKGKPNNGLWKVAEPNGGVKGGDPEVGWRLALDTTFNRVPGHTYYGNSNDYGTPGYRGGGPLPVSLSKFRPERLKATGEVVILWATESELNNAGFNILRSETRDGTYTKINTQLIQGQGTTSERTTYEWKDTTAKPNVAYYYQIQDVSLDGQVNTLRVNRLKGNVNAAGKATTTWGELKALQ